MKAIKQTAYGDPSQVLVLAEVAKPVPEGDQVLVKVRASSVTFGDLTGVKGKPWIGRLFFGLTAPKITTPGKDLAGDVEAVGPQVTNFKPGDKVFGDLSENGCGAFAEYVSVSEKALALLPDNLSYQAAAAVPESGIVALQGLRDVGEIKPGQKVLVNGASGGIGSFAVQIAKSYGANVTGVCSTRNLELVASLGADHVIDYTREDFVEDGIQYDLILATAGYRSIFDYKRALAPGGRYVATGGKMRQIFQPMLLGPWISTEKRKMTNLSAKTDRDDLVFLKGLIETGKVTPVIDRVYPLAEVAEALHYYDAGRSRGKVVISIDH